MNDVVAEIITVAPYKEIYKELKNKKKINQKKPFLSSNTRH
jgi:hypothetical protein